MRFLLLLLINILAVAVSATVLCLVGRIGVPALVWTYGLAALAVSGLLMAGDRDRGVRATGAAFLAVAILGAGLAVAVTPARAADAILIAAPPGDAGFWGSVNGWLTTAVGAVVTALFGWGVKLFAARTRIQVKKGQEDSLRELMLTGAYQGMHELEVAIDDHWTPAQRAKIVERVVGWAETRGAAELKKLGLPSFVVTAMARKVVGQLQAAGIVGDDFDVDLAGSPRITGNPGETPALDRAVGPAMGGN